ncbi:carbohydrate sulfotransferase 15-like [Mya arenaria]|uniref:carbohydrate sulfotransferase 15-like n=1 Tax=Mya arenaria TaxID=6604 RepID=UPI0022E08D3B|nr:carbohydrate sulfotransferase 15-like [Mya arenaria]
MNSRFFRQRFPKYVLVVGVLLVFIWIYSEIVNEALFSVNNAHIADTVEDILHHVKFDGKPSVKADVVESVCRQEKGNMDSEEPLCQKPPILDPMYRNPCWSSKGELECVPYFLVTGMPYGRMEEVFYDLLGHKDITDYADEAAEHGPIEHRTAVYGDYLYMDEADEEDSNTDNQQRGNRFLDLWRLQHVNPDIKIIVVLKDPVERVLDEYLDSSLYYDDMDSCSEFSRVLSRSLHTLKNCVTSSSLQECVIGDKSVDTEVDVASGFYSVFLAEWLAIFPRKNIMIINIEDYQTKKRSMLEHIIKFLQLQPISGPKLETILASEETEEYAFDCFEKELEDLYKPFNKKLKEIV